VCRHGSGNVICHSFVKRAPNDIVSKFSSDSAVAISGHISPERIVDLCLNVPPVVQWTVVLTRIFVCVRILWNKQLIGINVNTWFRGLSCAMRFHLLISLYFVTQFMRVCYVVLSTIFFEKCNCNRSAAPRKFIHPKECFSKKEEKPWSLSPVCWDSQPVVLTEAHAAWLKYKRITCYIAQFKNKPLFCFYAVLMFMFALLPFRWSSVPAPGLSQQRCPLDETGHRLQQAETDQQQDVRPGLRKQVFIYRHYRVDSL